MRFDKEYIKDLHYLKKYTITAQCAVLLKVTYTSPNLFYFNIYIFIRFMAVYLNDRGATFVQLLQFF